MQIAKNMVALVQIGLIRLIGPIWPIFPKVNQAGFIRFTKKTLVTYLITFMVFSGTGLLYLFNPFGTKSAEAAWFNDSWGYRKAISITAHSADETDTYISVTLADTDDLVTNGQLQSDCGDMRFTKQNGDIMPYYIASGCNSASTVVHVYFDSFPAGSQTVYFYYGNPVVSDGFSAADFSSEASSYTVGTIGTAQKASSPVAYWKLDEGQGTTTSDSTTNSHNGTITNAAWQTEDLCLIGKCLKFDGSGDYVDYGTSFTVSEAFSVSAWVKLNSNTVADYVRPIFVKGSWGSDANGDIRLEIAGDSCTTQSGAGKFTLEMETLDGPVCFADPNEAPVNTWVHISAVWDSNNIYLYRDGVQVASGVFNSSLSNNSHSTYIGAYPGNVANTTLNGFVDEVKVYNQAISAAQIKANFNARSNPEGVSTVLGANTQNMPAALSNGLVGYWKMESTTTPSLDFSGNANSGTWTGTTSTSGKFGNGNSFDGTDDKIQVADANSLDATTVTLSAWINATALGGVIIDKATGAAGTDGYYLDTSGSKIRFCATGGCVSSTTSLSTGTWTHVAATWDGTTVKFYLNGVLDGTSTGTVTAVTANAANLIIGLDSASTGDYSGKIDEARVYNRSLSPAEISQLYNWGPGPVGYWKLDEGTGTTIADSSGNANNSSAFTGNVAWSNTKYGKGLLFDGTDDVVRIPESTSTDLGKVGQSYTVMIWIKDSISYGSDTTFFQKTSSGNPGSFQLFTNNFNTAKFRFSTTNWSSDVTVDSDVEINDGKWHHIAGVRNVATGIASIYVDGVFKASTTDTLTASDISNNDDISIGNGSTSYLADDYNGLIDDAKIYNYARTQAQIVEDMNAGHPAPGSPVGTPLGHWKFDEGFGSTAHNIGNAGSALDLTLASFSSPATSTSGWSNAGKFNKAFNFDGTDDTATGPNDTVSDNMSNLTISAWIFPRSGTGSLGRILDKTNNGTGFRFLIDNGNLNFSASHATTDLTHITNAAVTLNTWQHVAVTWDGSTSASNAKIYINGVEQTSFLETTDGSGARSTDASQAIGIGNRSDGTRPFDGLIDEVKLYNQALTADQIKLDMNKGAAQVLGATGDKTGTGYESKTSENQKYCVPGDTATCAPPVLSYDLNEGTGTTANDSSGYENGGAGNITSGNGGWVNSKFDGKAYSFDGLTTHIFGGSNSIIDNLGVSTGMTAEAWVYPKSRGIDSSNAFIFAKNSGNSQTGGGWLFLINGISGNQVGLQFVVDGVVDLVRGTASTTLTLNQWNHVVVTWNGAMNSAANARIFVNGQEATYTTTTNGITRPSDASSSLYIGNASSLDRTFDGYIDQVKVFNYNRTPTQIAWDYNKGGPVGWWKMDECQGTTINDASGKSLSGTITLGASGVTSAGTCTTSLTAWGNGATGKRNASLSLDGTNDYVDLGTISSPVGTGDVPYSIAAWVKPSATRLDGCVFSYGAATSGQVISLCSNGSGNIYSVHYSNDHSYATAWTLGSWQHVIITYDPVTSTETLYINGQSKESWTPSNLNLQSSATSYLGRASWSGTYSAATLIDDIRLYNYPLTATQAKNLTNDGAYRVGPSTGSP